MKLFILALVITGTAELSSACSVLSHEAIVDAAWSTKIEPLLRARFPAASKAGLRAAHGYSYGGAIIQDLGYYPHGNKHFSDLTHYIRTGDFVQALLEEAKDLNEVAFALGALSHHASDSDVHRFATNPGEEKLYPRLGRKFGPSVTYEDDPSAHLKTEFGFDVLEVAKGNFAGEAYHDFIGFGVCAGLLDRAFVKTYGLRLADLFPNLDKSIGSYRRAVSKTIPMATRIAWAEREHDIQTANPGLTRKQFVYVMNRSRYERQWGAEYDHPTLPDRIAAVVLKLIPPVGPLRVLRFKMPTPEVEKLFAQSFNRSLADYGSQVELVRTRTLHLTNINYDLGEPAGPGRYKLQDETYAFWRQQLMSKQSQTVTAEIRHELAKHLGPGERSAPVMSSSKPCPQGQRSSGVAGSSSLSTSSQITGG
ncbi:MAG: zinc dependent phospholipase C family protein [Bryobacteraceae bacterium]